ncbi:MAG: dTDP-4-dehydrorhamnose 3,5-epimerase family protein [Candidatus Zixiibacteriota bacterium]
MIECPIPGVEIRTLMRHSDHRGWLMELFRKDELPAEQFPAMGYVSMLVSGAVRGPHEHRTQTDYFVLWGPSDVRLYLWDNRSASPTKGVSWVMDFEEYDAVAVLIPPGVVHAYENVGSKDTYVINLPNRLYAGPGRTEEIDEIRHEDDPNSPFRTRS